MFAFNDRVVRAVVTASLTLLIASLTTGQSPTVKPSSRGSTSQPSGGQDDLARTTWVDPSTGLRWTLHANGSHVNWGGAKRYCQNLNLGGAGGWRLPTLDELKRIWRPLKESTHSTLKGGIQLGDEGYFVWTSTLCGDRDGDEALTYYFGRVLNTNPRQECTEVGKQQYLRALCVRGGGK